jgi:hypothetical protein
VWTGSNQRHRATEDVEGLRQFIESEAAKELAEAGSSVVAQLAVLVKLAMENDGRTTGDNPPSHRGGCGR